MLEFITSRPNYQLSNEMTEAHECFKRHMRLKSTKEDLARMGYARWSKIQKQCFELGWILKCLAQNAAEEAGEDTFQWEYSFNTTTGWVPPTKAQIEKMRKEAEEAEEAEDNEE